MFKALISSSPYLFGQFFDKKRFDVSEVDSISVFNNKVYKLCELGIPNGSRTEDNISLYLNTKTEHNSETSTKVSS